MAEVERDFQRPTGSKPLLKQVYLEQVAQGTFLQEALI